jgi:phosphomannomutase
VKAYDVRGLAPGELGPEEVAALAQAFAELVGADPASAVVVGRDMRDTSPVLTEAVTVGITRAGLDVVDIGLASTDQLYFASGHLDLPGVMVTASHNPGAYNGLKLCRAGARPVGRETGLDAVRSRAENLLDAPRRSGRPPGAVTRRDVLADYGRHLRSLAPVAGRRLRVVVDAGNGMAGHTVPAVLGPLDLDVVPLYFELDGSFPHHAANPLDPTTLVDLQAAVRATGADLGLAFDGDADRCFVIDEEGDPVTPSAVTALLATRVLAAEPNATVVHNLICSRAVPEIIREHGGRPVRTPVGHSLIKAEMARSGAAVGGEHSGHFYFRDFWCADSGMLAALHVLAALAGSDETVALSALLAPYQRYVASGELNSVVPDPAAAVEAVRSRYAGDPGLVVDEMDGLTVSSPRWWLNLRTSNTEPLLRLNVEGLDEATMVEVRDETLSTIRAGRAGATTGSTA